MILVSPPAIIANQHTEAGRPQKSTCPGTENRLPGSEPLVRQLYHYPNQKQKVMRGILEEKNEAEESAGESLELTLELEISGALLHQR